MEKQLSFEQLPTAVFQLSEQLKKIENLILIGNAQHSSDSPDQLLTATEAAAMLVLTLPTVYSKVSKGELPHMKRSKRLYFSSLELMAYLKAGKRKTYAETALEADQYLANKGRRSAK